MYDFPSLEWAEAYKDAINANPEYRLHGKDWTHGVVAFVVKADPALGIPADTALWLDVHGGECRGVKLMTAEEAQEAAFVIVAPYSMWKTIIKKEIDPIKAMMQNKVKLTKGHMPTIVRYVNSSRQLVESTSRVPTKFRDE
jgi:putative sterol carrier protein